MRRNQRAITGRLRARNRRLTFEPLAARQMLAGDLVISEFMAVNDSTLADVDGEFADWFEITNTTASPINLNGYYATDDADDLTRWAFPSLTLLGGEQRVIFASGKDRTDPAEQLHTNFSLNSQGEFFALVRPNGFTIEHAYSPTYPPQLADISYGISDSVSVTDTLIDDGATITAHVPSNNSLGTTWTEIGFNDLGWITGDSGVGYDTQIGAPQFALIDIGGSGGRAEPGSVPEGQIGLAANSSASLPTTTVTSSVATGSRAFTISIDNGGLGGGIDWRDRGNSSSSDPLALLAEDHVKNNAGHLQVTLSNLPAGTYSITSYHADVSFTQSEAIRVFVDGVEQPGVLGRANFDLDINSLTEAQVEATAANFNVVSNGTDPVVIRFDGSQANDTEVPLSGMRIVANGPLYEGLIETNLEAEMFATRTSAYVRVPFTVTDATTIDSLTLLMHYDDGFVAYLNGTEVARRNAPASVSYDSASTIDRTDVDALAPVAIDIGTHTNLLVDGDNILAIHGLNDSASDVRFLIAPSLEAEIDFASEQQYFTTPTPAEANVAGVLGLVDDTKFSVDRGFFDAPFQVEITTATAGAEIRYTLDGTAPTATTGTIYSGPLPVTTTTTLRAAAFRPGYLPSNVDTQSYFFLADVIQQDATGKPVGWGHAGPDYDMDPEIVNDPRYSGTIIDDLKSIPTLSLVMDIDDLFGPSGQGIYLQGTGSPRSVSTEFVNPDGTPGFQVDASVQIQGGSSTNRWKTDKLSMRVKFKEPFGPTKLDYPLFGEDAATSFDTIILDGVLNYSWLHNFSSAQRDNAKYIQDQLVADLQNAVGGTAPHGTYTHLYLNGIYWGMYYVHERPDESFASSYLGGNKEDYNVIKHGSGNVVNGSNATYLDLLNRADQDLSITANYAAVEELLDIEDFIDYMIINLYLGNSDWAHHNWYASQNGVDPEGRWRFHSWDAEHVLTSLTADVSDRNNAGGPTRIHQQLKANAEYQQLFADRVQQHLFGDGALTADNVAAAYQARVDQVERAIVGESARWGDNRVTDPFTQDHWLATQQGLFDNYFPQRRDIVLNQFIADDLYPGLDAPTFSQAGGIVTPGFELGMAAAADIYYTLDGSDPRTSGGGIAAGAIPYQSGQVTSTLIASGAEWNYLDDGSNQGTVWTTTSFNDSSWASGNAQLGYGDNDETTVVSFGSDSGMKHWTTYFRHTFTVADPAALDTLTLRLQRDDGAVVHLNGEELVLSNMPSVYDFETPASDGVGGAEESTWFEFTIDPAELAVGENVIAVEVHQRTQSSSDISMDLELIGTRFQSDTPAIIDQRSSVRARAFNGTTWSALATAEFFVNVPAAAGNLTITEINYNPYRPLTDEPGIIDNDDFEFLEFRNISNDVIDLDGVHFTEGLDFNFTGGSIASLLPGEFVVAVKDLAAFEARYGTGLPVAGVFADGSLRNSGETLDLVDRFDVLIQSIDFSDSGSWPGRADGKGSSLEVIDPTADPNDGDNWRSSTEFLGSPGAQGIGPFTDVVINEVLTHTDLPQTDSIELYNTTDAPINVGHWRLSDSFNDYWLFEIPANTFIPAFGYLVFNENDFNPGGGTLATDFALSGAHGDDIYLLTGNDTGKLFRFADHGEVIAAPNGESFGRWPNGTGELFPMTEFTPGADNSGPRFGPLLITELMYEPPDPDGAGPLESQDMEFVEIYNSTGAAVDLTDWEVTGGVDYGFASGSMIDARQAIVLVSFDPTLAENASLLASFRSTYSIDNTVTLIGPFSGALNNAGERVRLRRPDEPPAEEPDFIPLLLEDEANYDSIAPWPTDPAGGGTSLTRSATTAWGNDPASWNAAPPTPGVVFTTQVVARHLFYNDSVFDQDDHASADDDLAIAPDKRALLPGEGRAVAANISSVVVGITGVMIDIAGLPPAVTLTAADFEFKRGRDDTPADWATAPNPTSITIRRGAGEGGSDRVTLIWPAGSITNTWLEVRVKANANTQLATDDRFYFGSAVGDTNGDGLTGGTDFMAVRANQRGFLNPATIDNPHDFNLDLRVNALDLLIIRDYATTLGTGLPLIEPEVGESFGKLAFVEEPVLFVVPPPEKTPSRGLLESGSPLVAGDDEVVVDDQVNSRLLVEIAGLDAERYLALRPTGTANGAEEFDDSNSLLVELESIESDYPRE